MKKLLLMLAAAVAVVAPATSQAIEDFQERYYVGVQGGANWLNRDIHQHVHLHNDLGYLVGGSVGYRTCLNVRFEGEFVYRHNDLNKVTYKYNDQKYKFNLHGRNETYSYMVNAIYDFPTCFVVKPYAGFGIGYAHSVLTSRFPSRYDLPEGATKNHTEKKDKFAWQAIAGLAYPLDFIGCIDYDIDATVEYRYFEPNTNRLSNQSLALGLRSYF